MTTATESRAKPAAKAKNAKTGAGNLPFEAEGNGVVAHREEDGSYLVSFTYNARMVAEKRSIEGAEFDREKMGWSVPAAEEDRLVNVLGNMRKEFVMDGEAKAEIMVLAQAAAEQLQVDNGKVGVKPMLTDFIVNSGEHSGQIIAANSRYAAQFTGFGKQDGAAFISLHQTDNLRDKVMKGDRVNIDYYNPGQQGAKVTTIRTKEERAADFENNMGKNVDGVRVIAEGDKFHVEFDFNPALSERISRIDGAQFDKAAKHWTVGSDKKSFLINAVKDMREEVVADRHDRDAMESIASKKIDGAKVKDAYTKDGHADVGAILAKSGRYVLQHTGKEYAALHRAAALPHDIEVGTNVRIEYRQGKGKVTDRGLSKGIER